jgi:hypothetical protein
MIGDILWVAFGLGALGTALLLVLFRINDEPEGDGDFVTAGDPFAPPRRPPASPPPPPPTAN